MAATVRSSSVTTGAAAGTTNATKPAGTTSGDLLVAIQTADSSSTLAGLTAPSGWTLLGGGVDSGTARIGTTKVWMKTAGGSEPSTYAFVANDPAVVTVVAVTGQDTSTPLIAYGQSTTATTAVAAPSLSPTAAGTLLLSAFADVNGFTFTVPTNQAQLQAAKAGTQNASSLVCSEAIGAAGPTGQRASTMSGAYGWTSVSVAIAPAAGTTTPTAATVLELGVEGGGDQPSAQAIGTGNLGAAVCRTEFTIGTPLATITAAVDRCAAAGVRLQPLIGWNDGTAAPDLTPLATWAASLGPGGSHWAGGSDKYAITDFELGNENSMYYKSGLPGDAGYQNLATAYGQRALAAAQAINNANPRVKVLVELEGGDSNQSVWPDRVLAAGGQTLIDLMRGPVIHLYGPNWATKLDLNRGFLANKGVTAPYYVTEFGLASDNGRSLSDNYGWPTNLTYAQAATNLSSIITGFANRPSQVRQALIFQWHDQRDPGATSEREHYFGVLTSGLADKGAITSTVRAALAQYRGGTTATPSPLIGSLADTFAGTALDPGWTANGAGVAYGQLYVNCLSNGAGGQVYSSARRGAYTWSGSALTAYDVVMPAQTGSVATAQLWMIDPAPADTVARFGFELNGANLDLIGQSGATYAPIGTTTTLTPYDPVAHRNLRIEHTGTAINWYTSPDGLSWTLRRTLGTVPTWASKTSLQPSFEAFRSGGTNDVLRIGAVNVAPTAIPTAGPSGADALQRRTLAEVRAWERWLSANGARGWVGEFGWVTLAGKYGDTPQQNQWNALADAYLTELDAVGLSGTPWASGREWGQGYPLGLHVGTNINDPLTIANGGSDALAAHRTKGLFWRGVNLSGHERGITISGGGTVRSTTPYIHSATDFGFLAANGVDTVRLPLAWERIQPTLGAALDTAALADLDGMIMAARAVGIRVLIDGCHNYGYYTKADGSIVALGGALTNAQFADYWTRLSTWVRADANRSGAVIGYDLLNEPHDLVGGATTWQNASQAAVTAIRNGGDTRLLVVEGYTFASLTEWATWHPTGWITDTAGNYCYSAHHYWDTTSALGSRSGTYQQSATGPITTYAIELQAAQNAESSFGDPGVGTDRVNWCTNPSLELAATGHSINYVRSGVTAAPALGAAAGRSSTVAAAVGTYYGYVNVTGPGTTGAGSDVDVALPRFPVTPGLPYTVSVARSASVTGAQDAIYIKWVDSAGANISGANALGARSGVVTGWVRKAAVNLVAPTGAAYLDVQLWYYGPADTTLRSYRWDAVLYEQTDTQKTYFDGSSVQSQWTGSPHASTSSTSSVVVYSANATLSAIAGMGVVAPAVLGYGAPTLAARAGLDTTGVRITTADAALSACAELVAQPFVESAVNYGTMTMTASMTPVAVAKFTDAALTARAQLASNVLLVTANTSTMTARAEVLAGTYVTPAIGSTMSLRALLDAGAAQTFTTDAAALSARAQLSATGQRGQAATAAFSAVTAMGATAFVPYAAAAALIATAAMAADGQRVTAGTAALVARARLDPSDTGARPAFGALIAAASLNPISRQTEVAAAAIAARAQVLVGYPVTAALTARASMDAAANRGHFLAAGLSATAAMAAAAVRVVPVSAQINATAAVGASAVIAIPLDPAAMSARARLLVAVPVVFHPVFRIPDGPVKPQTPVPTTRLLVANTITGRIEFELPFTSLSWNSPLNKIGACQAKVPLEATRDVPSVFDALAAQEYVDPRAAIREFLLGPFKYSLVVAYGQVAVFGGPLMPTDDEDDATVSVGAAGLERMLEKRVLLNRGVTALLTDAARDITATRTTPAGAMLKVLAAATEDYNGTPRRLPITCLNPPGSVGDETFTWRSYDLVRAWKAITDLTARVDGPDARLEPYLVQGPDAMYVNWDFQVGGPTFDVDPGTYGPDGPLPWTWDDQTSRIARAVDAVGMATTYYSSGAGQDRAKKLGSSQDDTLTDLGFPVLEEVDSGSSSEESADKIQSRASALNRAHALPADSFKVVVPIDGDPPLGTFRRGDVARLEVRRKLLIEPGDYLRRITDIAGGDSPYVTLSCDAEDELTEVG